MQVLLGWVQLFSAPLLVVLRALRETTRGYLLALIALALLVRLFELILYSIAPGPRQAQRIRLETEAFERRRAFLQPDQIAAQQAYLDKLKGSKWQLVPTLACVAVSFCVKVYSVLALFGALWTANALAGQPFAWTADITTRDPRHVLPLLFLLIGVVSLVRAFLKQRSQPTETWKPLRQALGLLVFVIIADLLPPAGLLYFVFLQSAESILPLLLGIVAAPFLIAFRKLKRG